MNILSLLAIGGLVASGAGSLSSLSYSDSTASDRRSVAITIYPSEFALVREVREIELDRPGTGTVRLLDVPARLDPRTVRLEPLTAKDDLVLLEATYRTGLLSPDELLRRYVGREVEIVEQAPDLTTRTSKATLLSMEGGPLYKIGDRIVVGQTGKVLLPELPPDLVARPTLLVTLRTGRAGRREVGLSYGTEGMSWSVDYTLVLDPTGRKGALGAWVTLDNRSGAGYRDASVELVAGEVRRLGAPRPVEEARAEAAAVPALAERPLFEHHLYPLERPVRIGDYETVQVRFLEARSVPVAKRYVLAGSSFWYRGPVEDRSRQQRPVVLLELQNSEGSGLGLPLPPGIVRVYEADRSGSERFVGEDRVGHVARDEAIRLEVGAAFDLVAERVQTDYRTISPRQAESAFDISIRNHKDEDVVVTVRESVGGDFEVLEASHAWKKADATTIEFDVPVARGRETKLRYRVSVRW